MQKTDWWWGIGLGEMDEGVKTKKKKNLGVQLIQRLSGPEKIYGAKTHDSLGSTGSNSKY